MKARVKATGEIVTITGTDGICLTDENGNYHLIRDLEGCEAMPDYWEKLWHQYVGIAMNGLIMRNCSIKEIVGISNEIATALVNELKEDSQCEK